VLSVHKKQSTACSLMSQILVRQTSNFSRQRSLAGFSRPVVATEAYSRLPTNRVDSATSPGKSESLDRLSEMSRSEAEVSR
jgi:hypothetical protein